MSLDTATLESTRAALRAKLHGIVPEFELDLKAELAYRINRLKAERGAVILGHNYMEPALFHSVCDYTGDSLELSRVAARARGGSDRLLRRAVHGRDGQDSQPRAHRAAAGAACGLFAGRVHFRRGRARPARALPGRAHRRLHQHVRGREGRGGRVLHVRQRGPGRGIAGFRPGGVPAGRVPGAQRGAGNRQDHRVPQCSAGFRGRTRRGRRQWPALRHRGLDRPLRGA